MWSVRSLEWRRSTRQCWCLHSPALHVTWKLSGQINLHFQTFDDDDDDDGQIIMIMMMMIMITIMIMSMIIDCGGNHRSDSDNTCITPGCSLWLKVPVRYYCRNGGHMFLTSPPPPPPLWCVYMYYICKKNFFFNALSKVGIPMSPLLMNSGAEHNFQRFRHHCPTTRITLHAYGQFRP